MTKYNNCLRGRRSCFYKTAIENELGTEFQWMPLQDKQTFKIEKNHLSEIQNRENWEEYFEWLQKMTEALMSVFEN